MPLAVFPLSCSPCVINMSRNDPGEETHQDTMLQHFMQTPETDNKVLGCLGLECSARLPRQDTRQRHGLKYLKFCMGFVGKGISDITRCPVQQESKVGQVEFTGHLELLSYCSIVISYKSQVSTWDFPHNLRRQQ